MRIRDYGIIIGEMQPGRLNRISDVPGVTVGHCTVSNEKHHTGVTVVMPCADNMFARKLPCASFVLNGFGKTCGLVQVDELGTLETPIALTNTLNVGRVSDAMIDYMLKVDPSICSVNPVVCECNDAQLNTITERVIGKAQVFEAIDGACADFEEGAVGGGAGMVCHGLKGGIGSASRVIQADGKDYALGVLVQCNHGRRLDLTIAGDPVGRRIESAIGQCDKGSCIVILATDLPLSDRQLRRVVKRCSAGLARLGSFIGHGSGEVFIGFSTANRVPAGEGDIITLQTLREERIEDCFRAAAECTEEAILNAMVSAETTTGPTGICAHSLAEFLNHV